MIPLLLLSKENEMRWLIVTVAVAGFCTAEARESKAREPLARPMERTPSIMVGGEETSPRAAKRRESARPRAGTSRRATASRTRPIVVPRTSGVYEAETRTLNRSLSDQGQLLQLQQRQQVENNLFRQEIQRSVTPSFCTPGSLGC